uniref:Uncharacterized protein n=1 Tax=Triticum urartu TaxID=4572 RepID=A0A8R7PGE8_TRIUA
MCPLQRDHDQHGHGGQVFRVVVHLAQRRLLPLRRGVATASAERVVAVGGGPPDGAHLGHVRLLPPGGQRVDGAVHHVQRLDVPPAARGQRGLLLVRPAPAPLQIFDCGHRRRVVGQRQVRGDHGQPFRVRGGAPRRRLERRHAEGLKVLVLRSLHRLRARLLHGGKRPVGANEKDEEGGEEEPVCHGVRSCLVRIEFLLASARALANLEEF